MDQQSVSDLVSRSRRRRSLPPPELRRLIRQRAGLTQTDIARVLGLHHVTVARYELGRREPRGSTRERYAELLDALVADL